MYMVYPPIREPQDNTKRDKTKSPPALPRHLQRINSHPLRRTAPTLSPPKPCLDPQQQQHFFASRSTILSPFPPQHFASRIHRPHLHKYIRGTGVSSPPFKPNIKSPPSSQMPFRATDQHQENFHSSDLICVPSVCAVREGE